MAIAWIIGAALNVATQAPCSARAPQAIVGLYDKPASQSDDGEPQVTVAVLEHRKQVLLRARGGLTATWTSAEGSHRRQWAGPASLTVELQHSHAAPIRWVVPLSDDVVAEHPEMAAAQSAWTALGIKTELQGSGLVLPLGQQSQDLRRVRLVSPVSSPSAGAVLAHRLMPHHAEVQEPEPERVGLPHGSLTLALGEGASRAVLGHAVDVVHLQSTSPIEVVQVPFGMGYAWASAADRHYAGTLSVVVGSDGTLTVVNSVPLEAMLRGVVPAEMPAAAPFEALKAQAIAARTNLLYELGQRHRHQPYHYCAEQHCQVYAGVDAQDARTDAAIDATRGAVLLQEGRLVHGLFSAACGGRTENNEVPWPQHADSALRSVSDQIAADPAGSKHSWASTPLLAAFLSHRAPTYCSLKTDGRSGSRTWRRTLGARALAALWAECAAPCGELQSVAMGPRGPGGRLLSLTLQGARCGKTLRRELPIRQALGGLPSAACTITGETDAQGHLEALSIVGTGWGHGVGLCQRGAMGRAAHGQNAEIILGHYYSGAQVRVVY